MLNRLLLGTASVILCYGSASGDALHLLESARQEATEAAPTEQAKSERGGFYLRAQLGANMMQTLNAQNAPDNFKVNAGIDFAVTAGYMFTEILGVEFQTGFMWNSLNALKGSAGKPEAKATGDIYQVPLVANFVVSIPLSKGQYEPLFGRDADLIFFAGGGGGYQNGNGSISTGKVFDFDVWTYRYQAGSVLQAFLSDNTKFGIYFRFSGTGEIDGNDAAGGSYKIGPLMNYAVGINLSIDF